MNWNILAVVALPLSCINGGVAGRSMSLDAFPGRLPSDSPCYAVIASLTGIPASGWSLIT